MIRDPSAEEKLADQLVAAIMTELAQSLPQVFDRNPEAAKAFVDGRARLLIGRQGVELLASP